VGRTLRRTHLPSGQQGTIIVAALAFLFALAGLSLLAFFAAHADLLVAGHRKKEREMFFAGEAVLHIALAEIDSPEHPAIGDEDMISPRETFTTGTRKGRFSGWEYLWKASFVPDLKDRDGDDATGAVLFNRAFGYSGSPFAKGGYPVIRIDTVVSQGAKRGALTAGMAHLCVSPRVEAAWTAAGPLRLVGEILISGVDHDADGARTREGGGVTGVRARGPVSGTAEVVFAGAGRGVVTLSEDDAPAGDPLLFLNPGRTLRSLGELPPPPVDGRPIRGMVFSPESWSGPLNGEGILVVHNPLYDPRLHEASRLAMEEGVFLSWYDPRYSHLDPARQPATLESSGGGDFHGLVVADRIGAVFDETRILGALVTLGREALLLKAYRRLEVLYSRAEVEKARRGPLAHRVFFKSLPGTAARMARMEDGAVQGQ
jgi:hypothetical protein